MRSFSQRLRLTAFLCAADDYRLNTVIVEAGRVLLGPPLFFLSNLSSLAPGPTWAKNRHHPNS